MSTGTISSKRRSRIRFRYCCDDIKKRVEEEENNNNEDQLRKRVLPSRSARSNKANQGKRGTLQIHGRLLINGSNGANFSADRP